MRLSLKLLLLILVCLPALKLPALSLESINAIDEGKHATNINIVLSDTANYRVESSSGSLLHRIIIPNTSQSNIRPDYKRLSPVIDRISYSQQAGSTVINIRTMKPSQLSHSQSGSFITLRLQQEGGSPLATKETKTSKPSPVPISAQKEQTASATEQKAVPRQLQEHTTSDSLATPTAIPQETQAPNKESSLRSLIRQYWYLVFVLLGIVAAIVIYLLSSSNRPKTQVAIHEEKEEEEPVLIMDPDTRRRMVMRLTDQGWTPQQIATELRMPIHTVQRIIIQSRRDS